MEEMERIVEAFLEYEGEVSEEKLKNLLIVPLLIACYLSEGRSLIDVYQNFSFAKEGKVEPDITIRSSKRKVALVEIKRKGEVLISLESSSSKIHPGGRSLEEKVNKPVLFLGSEGKIYHLDGDYVGQIYHYALQIFDSGKQELEEVNLIMTNGEEWLFKCLDRSALESIYVELKGTNNIVRSVDGEELRYINLFNLLDCMEEVKLRELFNEGRISEFFAKLRNYVI